MVMLSPFFQVHQKGVQVPRAHGNSGKLWKSTKISAASANFQSTQVKSALAKAAVAGGAPGLPSSDTLGKTIWMILC